MNVGATIGRPRAANRRPYKVIRKPQQKRNPQSVDCGVFFIIVPKARAAESRN